MAGRSSTPAADRTWECLGIPGVETACQGAGADGRYLQFQIGHVSSSAGNSACMCRSAKTCGGTVT